MKHFSRGQQTVIAIALILALQRCDPAPFYLFDEIDSALDSNYRSNIASIIEEERKKHQYFITTFKPELAQIKDANFLLVDFKDLISRVRKIHKEEALDLLINYDNKME